MKRQDTEAWGRNTARKRYGAPEKMKDADLAYQKPQDPMDKHGSGYDNDTSGWVRGKPLPPHFDKGK